MKNSHADAHENYPDIYHDNYSRTTFGFWIYLLSDFVFFGALFAAFQVLSNATHGGPSGRELFYLPFTFVQTCILLLSSLSAGLAGASAHRKLKNRTMLFFGSTFLLGSVFMGMEFYELSKYISAGYGWDQSAFLSAYFTVVGTHGLHVLFGLLWIIVLFVPLWKERDISHASLRRLTCLRMFWQFVNIIWVLIFSFVYLMGVKYD